MEQASPQRKRRTVGCSGALSGPLAGYGANLKIGSSGGIVNANGRFNG